MERDSSALTSEPLSSSSSPAPDASSAKTTTRLSTPPSSPPGFPWERKSGKPDHVTTSPRIPPRTAFSLLGKRKALDNVSDNARAAKKVATAAAKPEANGLTQMQISLGQEVQRKCKTCGMEYVPSSVEDRKLHDKYHRQNTEGYDVGKDFAAKARESSRFAGAREGDAICALDCFDTATRKRKGKAVLEVVQRELGAVEIPESAIWDVKDAHRDAQTSRETQYTAYLYIRASKCIGFLLVQKIREAQRVIEPAVTPDVHEIKNATATSALSTLKARQKAATELLQWQEKHPISLSTESHPARLGVCRIWTSATHRRQNIATALLDVALKDYSDRLGRLKEAKGESQRKGLEDAEKKLDASQPAPESMASKDYVAFSQPTEAGARLARRWFGRSWGWGVYVD